MSNAAAHRPVLVPRVAPEQVQEILRELNHRSRLLRLVRMMSLEIERLNQDNAQLYAAVKIYREVARQHLDRTSGRTAARVPQARAAAR